MCANLALSFSIYLSTYLTVPVSDPWSVCLSNYLLINKIARLRRIRRSEGNTLVSRWVARYLYYRYKLRTCVFSQALMIPYHDRIEGHILSLSCIVVPLKPSAWRGRVR